MVRLFAIMALAFGLWAGMKVERALQADRCLNAGGSVDSRGFCSGVQE